MARLAKGETEEQRALEIEERRTEVARLYLMHLPQTEIARRLNVGQATISRDIATVRAQYRATREALIERESRELDRMEFQCAERFDETQEREWMAERRAIKERRAKLLGLDAPTKAEVTAQGAHRVEVVFVNEWRSRVVDQIEELPEPDSLALPPSGAAEGSAR